MIHRLAQIRNLPVRRSLCNQSRQFADDVRVFGKQCDIALPDRNLAGRELRLAAMVEHKCQIGMSADHFQELRQMARQHQRIEYQASSSHRRQQGRQCRTKQPIVVGDVLNHRPQSHQKVPRRQRIDARDAVGCIEIRPADHAAHQFCVISDIEQKHRLGLGRRGLHQDSSLDNSGGEMRRQIREPKVTIDRRQLGRQPAIVATGESPQMMMRIDPHQRITDDGTGASVSSRCCAFRSVQSADGT